MPDLRPIAEPRWNSLVSLSFWVCALGAVALYAAVALAPVFHRCRLLQTEFDRQQREMVELERHNRKLQSLTRSLEQEPTLRRELAGLDFQAGAMGYQQIPLAHRLSLNPPASPSPEEPPPSDLETLTTRLATVPRLRGTLLAIAAGLIVFSFTFLQPARPVSAGAAR